MDTMNYYSQKFISPENIEEIAKSHRYKTSWLPEKYFGESRLNVHFGSDKSHCWQWYSMGIDDMWFDSETDKHRVSTLDPASILLFEYYGVYLSQVTIFMKSVMSQYGGWLDCKGNGFHLITMDKLSDLIEFCT